MDLTLVESIDDLLPQTQCGQCGYAGCAPYAAAIAGGAPLNRCPPGGEATILALAQLLERSPLPLDPSLPAYAGPTVARIDEERCIGCARCLPACPVDAIIGASKLMHTVVSGECTGCALCLPPCPVDCITLEPVPAPTAQERRARAHLARKRHLEHTRRLAGAAADALARRRARREARRAGRTE